MQEKLFINYYGTKNLSNTIECSWNASHESQIEILYLIFVKMWHKINVSNLKYRIPETINDLN